MQTIYIFDVYLHTFISFKLNRKINNRILDHFFSSIFSKFLTFGYWQKTMTDERNSCKKVRLDEKKKKRLYQTRFYHFKSQLPSVIDRWHFFNASCASSEKSIHSSLEKLRDRILSTLLLVGRYTRHYNYHKIDKVTMTLHGSMEK